MADAQATSLEAVSEETATEPFEPMGEAAAAEPIASSEAAAAQYETSPPPSAVLKYDVQALRQGNTVYGSGKITWQSDGQTYAISGEASVLFFTLFDFQSNGMIDEFGVSPVLYSQKRFRKSATNTHFHRERDVISFSASTLSYPRQGGEQDRASLIWQLAAIGRADPSQFTPGQAMLFFVAGVRNGETWQMNVMDLEEVETGEGKLSA